MIEDYLPWIFSIGGIACIGIGLAITFNIETMLIVIGIFCLLLAMLVAINNNI